MAAFSSSAFSQSGFSPSAFFYDGSIVVTETIARPNGDQSNVGWSASAGGALWPMLDEVTPDPSDYIYAETLGAVCKMGMSTTVFPGGAGQTLKYRASSSTGNSVTVELLDGLTTIRSVTQVLTPIDSEYSVVLSAAEIAAITSGTLSIQLTAA
jgi:hypothetical protein